MPDTNFELNENTTSGTVDTNDIDFNNISILSISGTKISMLQVTIKFFQKEDKTIVLSVDDIVKILAICTENNNKDLVVYTGKIKNIMYNQVDINTFAPIITIDCSTSYGSKLIPIKLSDIRDIVQLNYVPENSINYYTKEEINAMLSWTVIKE